MMLQRSVVKGVGSHAPSKIVTNDDLSKELDTSDDWIRKRTGIAQRHIADEGVLTSDIAVLSAQEALKNAGLSVGDVDLIIVATSTPDNTFPATATRVQAKLGVTKGAAFDVQAVCSGFIFALVQADNMIRLGQATTALVIGAELCSRIVDWSDRSTCVLFGDGAGAVVLQASSAEHVGVIGTSIFSDGVYYDDLRTNGGVATDGRSGFIEMNGREVFRHAVENMSASVLDVLSKNDTSVDQVDYFVPHQANYRIIAQVGHKLGIPMEKVIVTVDEYANTSAATIPMALAWAVKNNKFKKGDRIVLTAMGAGFCWGAALLIWGDC